MRERTALICGAMEEKESGQRQYHQVLPAMTCSGLSTERMQLRINPTTFARLGGAQGMPQWNIYNYPRASIPLFFR